MFIKNGDDTKITGLLTEEKITEEQKKIASKSKKVKDTKELEKDASKK